MNTETTNGWTLKIEQLLSNWSQQVSINEQQYMKYGQRYYNYYILFGMLVIISQTGALTTILNVITQDTTKNILIGVAVLQTLVIIFQAIDKFFNFGSASQQYYEAAKNHNALSKFIDSTLVIPRKDRTDARETLISIRNQFNELKLTSPSLPSNNVIHKLDMLLYEDPREACGVLKDKPIKIGQSKGILYHSNSNIDKQETVVELPNIAEKVNLPQYSGELDEKQLIITFTRKESDPDEETISQKTETQIRQKIQQTKTQAIKEQNKGFMNILNYQWTRLEEHGEK
jgi:hypothetical protein